MILIFVDSSVLISAAMSRRGHARDLIMMGLSGIFTLIFSQDVFAEAERNIYRKAPHVVPVFEMMCDLIATPVPSPPDERVREIMEIIHTKDAAIVAAAVEARADWLATYDRKHLLAQRDVIQGRYGVTIAPPIDIIATLQ